MNSDSKTPAVDYQVNANLPGPCDQTSDGSGVDAPGAAESIMSPTLGNRNFLEADPDTQTAMILADFKAAYRLLEGGGLDQHSGLFAAFLNERLVGTDTDSAALRTKVSQEQHVHPERIAVIHVIDQAVL